MYNNYPNPPFNQYQNGIPPPAMPMPMMGAAPGMGGPPQMPPFKPNRPGLGSNPPGLPASQMSLPQRPGGPDSMQTAYGMPAASLPIRQHLPLPVAPHFVQQQGGKPLNTLFLGAISSGITNEMLQKLLDAIGPVVKLRRDINVAGKPLGLAFVDFEDEDSVLRAIKALNAVELPNFETASGPYKKLIAKVDPKSDAHIKAYAASQNRTEADDSYDDDIIQNVKRHVEALHAQAKAKHAATQAGANPNTILASDLSELIPKHLHDLDPSTVPEEKREAITNQIASFRQSAAQRELDKRRQMLRADENRRTSSASHERTRSPSAPTSAMNSPKAPRAETSNLPETRRIEKSDEELEQERRERLRKSALQRLEERERKIAARENNFIRDMDKDEERDRLITRDILRDRESMLSKLQNWDDEANNKAGRDLWYTDRNRWRQQRQHVRRREAAADEADARQEAQDEARLHKEADDFFATQAADMGSLLRPDGQMPQNGSIRVSLGKRAVHTPEPRATTAAPSATFIGAADEDEQSLGNRRRRELITLEYEDEASRNRERMGRLKALAESLPSAQLDLLAMRVEWSGLSSAILEQKILPSIKTRLQEYFGEADEDLLSMIEQHIRGHRSAKQIIEELEPVMSEDAQDFVGKFWRLVVFEAAAGARKIDSMQYLP